MKKMVSFLLLSLIFCLSFSAVDIYAAASQVGEVFHFPSSVPAPTDPILGKASRMSYGYASTISKPVKTNVWGKYSEYKDYNSNFVTIWKYPLIVNMTMERGWSSYRIYEEGDYIEEIFTHSYAYTETIEETTTAEFEYKFGGSAGASVEIDGIGVKQSTHYDVRTFLSSSIASTRSSTVYTSKTELIHKNINETSYYMYETRGNFYVYVIQVLEPTYYMINYTPIKFLGVTTGHKWDWAFDQFKLIDQNIVFSFIPDSNGTGYFKYRMDTSTGKFVYNDAKYGTFVYY